jgi:ABC-type xylose transport system substrate-binding protein
MSKKSKIKTVVKAVVDEVVKNIKMDPKTDTEFPSRGFKKAAKIITTPIKIDAEEESDTISPETMRALLSSPSTPISTSQLDSLRKFQV